MHKKLTLLWFVFGLGSKLQVIASLSITEIIVLISAPFILIKSYRQMRMDGVMLFFILSLMVIVGCIVASLANGSNPQFVLRGLAATSIISCSIIFAHWILRRDPGGFKWYILALPFSAIISTFYFKSAVEMTMLGESSEEIMSGPIFWITRLTPLVLAPTKGWYLRMPGFINILAPLVIAGFAILTSTSGRSAALIGISFAIFVVIGGKTRKSISRISRHFWSLCIMGGILVGVMYLGYKVSASRGWLGEEAQKKYESQTGGGSGGIGRLILGGRGESFIGLLACRDKPIVGWGPWAKDENGYAAEFITRFGTREDVDKYQEIMAWRSRVGIYDRLLSCHAYITEFWVFYGIWGLLFWLYVIFVLLRYLKQDVAAVPQWYGWLACSIPGMFWGIFFSPFADRVGIILFIVACLMARAVRRGRFQLPVEMQKEIN